MIFHVISFSQVQGNALQTVLREDTNVGLLGTASAYIIFLRLPDLQSAVFDACGESGL
jgi:hypothetical protein